MGSYTILHRVNLCNRANKGTVGQRVIDPFDPFFCEGTVGGEESWQEEEDVRKVDEAEERQEADSESTAVEVEP